VATASLVHLLIFTESTHIQKPEAGYNVASHHVASHHVAIRLGANGYHELAKVEYTRRRDLESTQESLVAGKRVHNYMYQGCGHGWSTQPAMFAI